MSTKLPPKMPRAGDVALAGHPWLARMIDKARLEAEGVIDEFDLVFPCPMDQRLLAQLGIEADEFQQVVVARQSDEAIIAELQQRSVLPAP